MFTLILILINASGSQETRTPVDSLANCRAQAQLITGDKRKDAFVFTSANGRAVAICKPAQ